MLMDYCPDHLREECHKEFLRLHRDALKRYRVPWYVPECFGGLGLACIERFEDAESVEDCKLSYVIGPSKIDLLCLRLALIDKMEFKNLPSENPINVRKVSSALTGWQPRKYYTNTLTCTHESLARARGLLDLYSVYCEYDSVLDTVDGGSLGDKALQFNERQWSKLVKRSLGCRNLQPLDRLPNAHMVESGIVVF
jgi:hypothetical protein